MWKSVVGHVNNPNKVSEAEAEKAEDEWETDPDFVNDVSEEEQRWGSKTIEGSGRTAGAIDMQKLVQDISRTASNELKRKRHDEENNSAEGGAEKLSNPTTITVGDSGKKISQDVK